MQKYNISTSFSAIFSLIWPQMLMMYILCIINIAPIWASGKINAPTQAAFGVAMQVLFFLGVVCIAISAGATSVISQAIGAHKITRAHNYVWLTLIINFILALFISFLARNFSNEIFYILAVPKDTLEVVFQFWDILICSIVFSYIFNTCVVVFRSFRQVKIPLIITAVVCIFHLYFIIYFGLGGFDFDKLNIKNLAYANVFSQAIGAVLSLVMLFICGHLKIKFLKIQWIYLALPYLLKVALHSGATSIVWQGGNLALFSIVAALPKEATQALVGLSGGNRIESLLFMAGMAFHMSASVIIGNCLGAKKEKEVKKVALNLVLGGAFLMSIAAAFLWPFMDNLASFLTKDAIAKHYTIEYLIYNIASTPFSVASSIFAGVMIGAGAAHFNLLIFGLTFWFIRIPLAYLLGHIILQDASGVFMAMLISQIIQTMAMFWIFFKLDWTKYKMR